MSWRGAVVLCAAIFLPACEESGDDYVAASGTAAKQSEPSPADAGGRRVKASRGSAVGIMAGALEPGYARALAVRPFVFPADHGPHADFRTEWWYFTGNLRAAGGRRFGFQLTLFRLALAPPQPAQADSAVNARTSRFATRQAWMGHFALSDVDGHGDGPGNAPRNGGGDPGRFYAFQRLERGAAGLAGARAQPFRIWLRDWQVSGPEQAPQAGLQEGADSLFPLHLRAAESGISVDLRLQRGKARVLQGDAGLSRKSAAAGNASYYYSYTRLPASGRVRTAEGDFQVNGLAWLDREWSSSALAPDQSGWDWFALHLDDGRDLMVYRLRDQHGGTHPYSAGMLVAADGARTPLRVEQMNFEPGRTWRSPDGGRYPVVWKLRAGSLQLQVRALFDAQAHGGRFRYWEGAVEARGRDAQGPVSARGYLEMTGYE